MMHETRIQYEHGAYQGQCSCGWHGERFTNFCGGRMGAQITVWDHEMDFGVRAYADPQFTIGPIFIGSYDMDKVRKSGWIPEASHD